MHNENEWRVSDETTSCEKSVIVLIVPEIILFQRFMLQRGREAERHQPSIRAYIVQVQLYNCTLVQLYRLFCNHHIIYRYNCTIVHTSSWHTHTFEEWRQPGIYQAVFVWTKYWNSGRRGTHGNTVAVRGHEWAKSRTSCANLRPWRGTTTHIIL